MIIKTFLSFIWTETPCVRATNFFSPKYQKMQEYKQTGSSIWFCSIKMGTLLKDEYAFLNYSVRDEKIDCCSMEDFTAQA